MFGNYIVNQIRKRGYEIFKPGVSDKVSITYRKIFSQFNIDYLIDVGANEGQFAKGMRTLGYNGIINSFEPLSEVFDRLKKNAASDPAWNVHNIALGNKEGQQEINVSKNMVSSSLLEMLPDHVKRAPDSIVIAKENIQVRKLDSILDASTLISKNIFLKLDVQGYEKFVLEGAMHSLKDIKLIQLEMALTPLYKGEALLSEMINYMDTLGYKLYNILNGFNNYDTGQLLQVDGIFVRAELID